MSDVVKLDSVRKAIGLWTDYLENTCLEDGSDTLTVQQVKKFVSYAKKELRLDQRTIEQSQAVAVVGHAGDYETKILAPFITRDRLISRAYSVLEQL